MDFRVKCENAYTFFFNDDFRPACTVHYVHNSSVFSQLQIVQRLVLRTTESSHVNHLYHCIKDT